MKIPITIHAAEDLIEFRDCIESYGLTPIELLSETGLLGPDVIVGHGLFTSGNQRVFHPGNNDTKLLAETGTSVAHVIT